MNASVDGVKYLMERLYILAGAMAITPISLDLGTLAELRAHVAGWPQGNAETTDE